MAGKTPYKYLALLGFSLILVTCSVEKNTDTTRFYHNMTSRYNIYFNGYESFKAGLAKISKRHQDDYSEMLGVFEYSDPSTVSVCTSDMERAMQKASKLISLKSITAKPKIKNKNLPTEKEKELLERKEYNDWVDDSYFLIAKARFYKHEYKEATDVFNYCIAEANDPGIKKESAIWLARINNETGNYSESLRLINELDITTDFTKTLMSMYYSTLADLFVKQKKYSEAIEPLEKAIDLVSGKRSKYRLTYLLAQLYEQTDNGAKASLLFQKVIKMNPPYDVEFNARINVAGVFDVNSGNPSEIKRELLKMLRDVKNKDFQDQIYFALGNLSLKEGNEPEAVEYFIKSANSTTVNQNQKGKSYLALASHFYEKPDYMRAGKFYDSAVYFIDSKYPGYQAIKSKSQNLNSLVSQLTIIQTQDSLQKVALMPEAERNNLISSMIAKIEKAESEGKLSEYSDRYNIGQFYENERRSQNTIEQEGKWYFYNQSALTFGRTEFRRRWGGRKLEDNWRRSNKATVNTSQFSTKPEEGAQNGKDTSAAVMDYKKPEFYLKNLPLSDSLLNISNEKIINALFNAGKAYAENLSDPVMATATFESLISRFPSSDIIPEALYNLYKINKDINGTRAETYRQKLLEKYPDSEFAMILSDPGYFEKKMADQKMAENTYNEAYNTYISEKFNEAITMCDDALKKYPKESLAPKFQLLKAYCVARISDERKLKEELALLIKTWPGTPESKKAEEISAFLNQKMPELKFEEDKEIAAELYVADKSVKHVFALVINNPSFNINQATFDVISFNIDNFTNKNLKTAGELVDNKYIIIVVSGFADYSQAFDYYNLFDMEKSVRNSSNARMMKFVISNDNLKILNNDKNPERYQIFFKENYLK
ncbi:MAG TPA: tetratricopeptide repeat protein [Bacteroidales bacterium]|nr:tetratricopeptide repeat protein [Bacteroidales bacterium]